MSRSWYDIKNQAAAEADVYVYDEIGSYGISAKEFVRDLRAVSAPVLNLHLNSPGGDVFDGVAIYNSLKNHAASVHVYVDGIAASSASFVAQAGDRVVMAPSATMMIHEPYGMAMGDAETMAKMAETLSKVGDTIAGIYAARAGGTEAEWRQRMQAETWYRAQEAVAAGLADELSATAKGAGAPSDMAPRVFNLSKFRNVPDWVQSAQPRDAGRTMSQANLDKLHSAMQGLDAVHGGTCDMGGDCPMGGAQNRAARSARANRAGRRPRMAQTAGVTLAPDDLERIDAYLDGIEANAEAIESMADAIETALGIEDEPEEDEGQQPAGKLRNAEWDTQYINDLPDSAFAVIKAGGKKDDSGKTVPRSLRMLPHHNSSGAVDVPHLRNALARVDQADLTDAERSKAKAHLDAHAKDEGVGDSDDIYRYQAALLDMDGALALAGGRV